MLRYSLKQDRNKITLRGGTGLIIIGEKINGAIPSVAEAIRVRNADFIKELAVVQTESGANYLDICAGTSTDKEFEALTWLVDTVQNAVRTPICIDSPDPHRLVEIFPRAK